MDGSYRHEKHSLFGEFRRFETKIGDLHESCGQDSEHVRAPERQRGEGVKMRHRRAAHRHY